MSLASRRVFFVALLGAACAHIPAPSASHEGSLSEARESVRQQARLSKVEAQLAALEARVQTLQAQARAVREAAHAHNTLPYERWQPRSLESFTQGEERAIEGQGDAVQLSVQSRRGAAR